MEGERQSAINQHILCSSHRQNTGGTFFLDDVPEMSFNNSDAVDLEEEEENEWEEVLNETDNWMNVMDYSDAGMSSFDISYIENVGQELSETD